MDYLCKWAIFGFILGATATASLHAQSPATPTIPSLPKVDFSCPRSTTTRSVANLMAPRPQRPAGLNIDPTCLPQLHIEFLQWEPWSIVKVPVKGGTPMLCGIASYNGKPVRFCTRG